MFIHAAQIAAITVYIMFGPPKMELLPTPMHALHCTQCCNACSDYSSLGLDKMIQLATKISDQNNNINWYLS